MLRPVERVMGEGDLVREGEEPIRVGYEITLYRHWEPRGAELVPGPFQVEGLVLATSDALERALGVSAPLTLHLDGGRRCDLYVVNMEGVVTSADERGFY
jgi:hypothetical protein